MKNTVQCGNVNADLETKNFLTVVYKMPYLYLSAFFFKFKR